MAPLVLATGLLDERDDPDWRRPGGGGWLERPLAAAFGVDDEHFALETGPSADGSTRILRAPWFSLPVP